MNSVANRTLLLTCYYNVAAVYFRACCKVKRVCCIVDGPKFINCAGVEVRRRLYEQAVSVDCDIQAKPVVDSVTVHWTQSPTRNVSLASGHRDGHYVVLLQPTNTSVRTQHASYRYRSRVTCAHCLPCRVLSLKHITSHHIQCSK